MARALNIKVRALSARHGRQSSRRGRHEGGWKCFGFGSILVFRLKADCFQLNGSDAVKIASSINVILTVKRVNYFQNTMFFPIYLVQLD